MYFCIHVTFIIEIMSGITAGSPMVGTPIIFGPETNSRSNYTPLDLAIMSEDL